MTHKKDLVSLRWGLLQNGSDMSTTRDLLNDMYCILLRCGSFQNGSGMFTKSTREGGSFRTMICDMEANSLYCNYMEIGMLSHLLYSSLGLQLGYKVICFFQKGVQHICSNLTNYRNCSRLDLYCENTSAHALKAVVNVRYMLETTASLTLVACQTVYRFKAKALWETYKIHFREKRHLSIDVSLSHCSTIEVRVFFFYTSTVRYSTVSDTFMKDSGLISVQSQHGFT